MLDDALVGMESLNVRSVSARAPVLHCCALAELRHVAQRRTGNVLAPPAVKQENATATADEEAPSTVTSNPCGLWLVPARGFILRFHTLSLSIHWQRQRIGESH